MAQEASSFYVYAYLRPDGSPYYIGKGQKRRAWDKSSHTIKPPNDNNLIVIMEEKLTEIGALALERFYIRWYGRKDLNTGILRNMTDGGDGSRPGPEVVVKIKQARQKQVFSKETKEKISYNSKTRWEDPNYRQKMLKTLTEVNRRPDKRKKSAIKGKRNKEWVENQAKTLRGKSNSVLNTRWYNNGHLNIRCVEGSEPTGYVKGRMPWKNHGLSITGDQL